MLQLNTIACLKINLICLFHLIIIKAFETFNVASDPQNSSERKLTKLFLITQGDSEFIGRALSRPIVKLAHEKYEKPVFPPALEWFEILRGDEKAGELLAAFELLQVLFPFFFTIIKKRKVGADLLKKN